MDDGDQQRVERPEGVEGAVRRLRRGQRGVAGVAVLRHREVVAGVPLGQDLGEDRGMPRHDVGEVDAVRADERDPGHDQAEEDRPADADDERRAAIRPRGAASAASVRRAASCSGADSGSDARLGLGYAGCPL